MSTAGIAIDNWKLPIFERHLSQSGYTFEKCPFTVDTMLLTVKTTNIEALAHVIKKANTEAAKTGETL